MKPVAQELNDILASLQPLVVEWQDDVARRVIAKIESLSIKKSYSSSDVRQLLDADFDDGLLICRLFFGQSKDLFMGTLREALKEGVGITLYRKRPDVLLDALIALGILEEMALQLRR